MMSESTFVYLSKVFLSSMSTNLLPTAFSTEEQALPLATTMRDAGDNRYFVFSMLAVDVLYDNVVLRSCLFGTQS